MDGEVPIRPWEFDVDEVDDFLWQFGWRRVGENLWSYGTDMKPCTRAEALEQIAREFYD